MKLIFDKDPLEKTMGLRVSMDDYRQIEALASKHNVAMQTLVSKIVHLALKEIED